MIKLMSLSILLFAQVSFAQDLKVEVKETTYTLKTNALEIASHAAIENLDGSVTLINPMFLIGSEEFRISGEMRSRDGLCHLLGKKYMKDSGDYISINRSIRLSDDGVILDLNSSSHKALSLITCE